MEKSKALKNPSQKYYHFTGRIVDGKDVELTIEITTDIIINCRTILHRYPFGTHQCSFKLFIRDTYPLKFHCTHDLLYHGGQGLKDYDLLNITLQRAEKGNNVFTSVMPSVFLFSLYKIRSLSILLLNINYMKSPFTLFPSQLYWALQNTANDEL